jgi:hypothetical protein
MAEASPITHMVLNPRPSCVARLRPPPYGHPPAGPSDPREAPANGCRSDATRPLRPDDRTRRVLWRRGASGGVRPPRAVAKGGQTSPASLGEKLGRRPYAWTGIRLGTGGSPRQPAASTPPDRSPDMTADPDTAAAQRLAGPAHQDRPRLRAGTVARVPYSGSAAVGSAAVPAGPSFPACPRRGRTPSRPSAWAGASAPLTSTASSCSPSTTRCAVAAGSDGSNSPTPCPSTSDAVSPPRPGGAARRGDQQVDRRDVQRVAILFGCPRLGGSSETGCRPRSAPDQQL